jgi:hypothetical protein
MAGIPRFRLDLQPEQANLLEPKANEGDGREDELTSDKEVGGQKEGEHAAHEGLLRLGRRQRTGGLGLAVGGHGSLPSQSKRERNQSLSLPWRDEVRSGRGETAGEWGPLFSLFSSTPPSHARSCPLCTARSLRLKEILEPLLPFLRLKICLCDMLYYC